MVQAGTLAGVTVNTVVSASVVSLAVAVVLSGVIILFIVKVISSSVTGFIYKYLKI